MDAFVKIVKQKNVSIIGRDAFIKTLSEIIKKNETICVYGDIGVGKTYTVRAALEGTIYTELSLDRPISYEMMRSSVSHVLVDNVDFDNHVWKELHTVLTGRKSLTRGATVLICQNIKNVDFCDCIKLEPLPRDVQIQIAKLKFPFKEADEAVDRADGNVRNLIHYMEGSNDKDFFVSPKHFIHSILSKSDIDASDYIGSVVDDHGYSWGIIHENYLDALNMTMDKASHIIDNVSLTDVYDNNIYDGDWDLLPYFCHHGIIVPAIEIEHTIYRETIRPGSSWTKFNNFKMRMSKLVDMKNRARHIDVDTLMLIRDKCIAEPDEAVKVMMHYKMIPDDIDVLNHLALVKKLKPKAVQSLKKKLKNALDE
jgi:hypothetical protein